MRLITQAQDSAIKKIYYSYYEIVFVFQCPQDGWLARLGVFGRIEELSTFKLPSNSIHTLSSSSLTLKLLAQLLLCSVHGVDKVDVYVF